jgi:hypothetical protein
VDLQRLRGGFVLVAVAIALSAVVVGSGDPRQTRQRSGPDPEVVATVTEAGEWVLPRDATVIAGSMVDTYALTLAMPPASVDVLLRESRFTVPLEQGTVAFSIGADGSWLVPGPAMWSAWQNLPRRQGELRLVVVDRSDPDRAVVHLEVWT